MSDPAPSLAAQRPISRVPAATLLSALLDGIPEYVYFKDRNSRYIAVSRSLVEAFGKKDASEVVGRTDLDFYAEQHARRTLEDEQAILTTGTPILDRLESVVWPSGRETCALTMKLPLRNRDNQVVGTFGLSKDVTEKKSMEGELDKAHRDLVEASRIAGMAEVATGVLHNVGNVLNSLNVSASIVGTGLRNSKVESLSRVSAMLKERNGDLGAFLSSDAKGRRIPEFISSLAVHFVAERDRLLQEIGSLQKNIDHIKEIVTMQQAYATMIGVVEALDPVGLMEDAVRMNAGALERHQVQVDRDFQRTPHAYGEQAKVLQILVNLIRNAKYACDEGGIAEKRITLRIQPCAPDRVQMIVQDNGVGIPPENLTRIFQHGFTTRAKGHGFGLHSAANAAKEMKGTLTVKSEGTGRGATFTLELPVAPSTPDT